MLTALESLRSRGREGREESRSRIWVDEIEHDAESPGAMFGLATGATSMAASARAVPVMVPSLANVSWSVSTGRTSHCGPTVLTRSTLIESKYGRGL
jgi:hypothetical protein